MPRQFKGARCECGLYGLRYAAGNGHICSDGPQPPAKTGVPAKLARRAAVLVMRNNGMTLQQIGDCIGVTRERVRQIIAGISSK